MKGRNEFTSSEKEEIIRLIEEKVIAPINMQGHIRNQIREIGFYYSDFETGREEGGYNVANFEKLITEKKITIDDNTE